MRHDPAAPRLRLVVEPIPTQPWLNREAIDRAARLYHHPAFFPELTGHALAGRGTRLRARRSSRREAWALLAASIARHTDRRTFRIGDQRDDGLCNGISIARYMAETGLSRWVVGAVLREFEAAGYIVTHGQPVQALTDKAGRPLLDAQGRPRHRGFASVRQVTHLFFSRLGFTSNKVKKARARGYNEWQKRRAPALSAVAILGGRRALRRVLRANQARNERLQEGKGPESHGNSPAGELYSENRSHLRREQLAAEREKRLEALPPLDTGPPAKPRRSP